jgi:hypothetical protein
MTSTLQGTLTANAALPANSGVVEVTFCDEFGRDALGDAWGVWNADPALENGAAVLTGENNWNNAIFRSDLREGEGILLAFEVDAEFRGEFSFAGGLFDSNQFRSWGLSSWDGWRVVATYGVEASEGRTYREPTLLGNTPYMLLIRIGADGEYQTRIWHADDPSRYMTSVDVIPPGGSWEGRGWDFVIKAYSGVARVDSYAELSFSDEYVLPNAPPVLPCQGAGATETAEATTEADIAVTYQDDFDGAAVSEEWIIWDQPPSLENGAAVFREEENWNALMRSGFEPGEGVLILFRHSGDYIGGMNLEIGDYEDETYRFVGAQRWDTWWSSAEYGKNGRETVLYGDPILNADEWYYWSV